MPDYSSADTANFPASVANTCPLTTAHDDSTDRDAATPDQYAGAHLRKVTTEVRATQNYVLAVTGLYVTDNGVLDVAFSAGRIRVGDGAPVDVAASTLTVADDDTSYIECAANGTVSDNTTGFSANAFPMATVVAASGDISSVTDDRTGYYLADESESNIGDLGNVVITSVADNEVLAYDNGSSKWINQTPTEAGLIAAAGDVPLTGNWDVGAYTITGTRFISDIAGGTAPFGCTSTTVVPNLNASLLEGNAASAFAAVDHDANHERAGSDEIDGDHLDVDFTPAHYTPDTTPAEAANVDDLAAHLRGIDDALDDTFPIQFVIDGGGSAITTGQKGHLEVPLVGNIVRATALADQSGSIVVDIWKDTYANFPPDNTDSITASAPVTISAATKSQDSTLTGWTKTMTAGDVLAFNVDSCATITRCTISLWCKRIA